jgi:hypothetical protein
MPDQHGFGDNATEATRPCQSGQGDDQMNEYDSEVAHPGNGINTSKTTALRSNLAISHRQVFLCRQQLKVCAHLRPREPPLSVHSAFRNGGAARPAVLDFAHYLIEPQEVRM